MSLASDLKILFHMTLAPIRGGSHRDRLESFYAGQAKSYDSFRAHLLRGRQELYQSLPVPEGGVWIEMGGGTGHNLQYLGDQIRQLGQVHVVDLSTSLLGIARERIAANNWSNVEVHEADVTTFQPPQLADVITFSYSLTMIPDWFAALERARQLLKPGGTLGVVDFYVARKYPAAGHRKHSWFTRSFWPVWLGSDNVFPNPDHVPYLHRYFEPVQFNEEWTRMRYFPLVRVPYYRFIGRKPLA